MATAFQQRVSMQVQSSLQMPMHLLVLILMPPCALRSTINVTDGQDSGMDEVTFLNYWRSTGLGPDGKT